MCRNYSYLGSRRDGGFGEYAAVPEWNLIRLPKQVSFEEAAMLEPMAVAVHAMRRGFGETGGMEGKTAAVCGLGTIGLLLLMFLKEAGVSGLFAVGNKDFQRTLALELGIGEENYCDSRKEDVSSWLMERTGGEGTELFLSAWGKMRPALWQWTHLPRPVRWFWWEIPIPICVWKKMCTGRS